MGGSAIGSVHILLPRGEVRVQGNPEQQTLLLDMLKEFTDEVISV